MADIFETLTNSEQFRGASGIARGGRQGDPPGFTNLDTLPSPSGSDLRQARIANNRNAILTRNMVRWFLPELGIVEMYVNPKSIKYTDKKHIASPVRTRSGYLIQYWGEELGTLSINGTTGSSGVEGINVLYDVTGVDQVTLPFTKFYRNDAPVADETIQNLDADKNEYLRIGTLTVSVT